MEYAISGDSTGIVRWQTWERKGAHFVLGAQYAYRTDTGLGVPEVAAHPRRTPPRPGARFHLRRRQHRPPLPGRPAPRHRHERRREPHRAGRRTPGQEDPPRRHRELPVTGSDREAAAAQPLLDNIEGMVITGRTHGGLRVLLVSDDNQNAVQTTRFYFLRVRTA